jgi:hypothetical protein
VGGPAGSIGGAVAGVAITKTIRRVGVEVYDRLLIPRQQERVGTVLAVALDDAQAHAEGGQEIRDDGFFDSVEGRRSDAEELLEGVLLQAANAYQERKLRHLGRFCRASPFDRTYRRPTATGSHVSRIA